MRIEEARIAVLLCMEAGQDRDYIKAVAKQIHEELSSVEKTHIHMASGDICQSLWDIQQSVLQALDVLDNIMGDSGEQVLFHDEMKILHPNYYYPLARELQLVELVKAGEASEVKRLLEEIILENQNQALSSSTLRQLCYELRGTAIKLGAVSFNESAVEQRGFLMKLDVIEKTSSSQELLLACNDAFGFLCEAAERNKHSHNDSLKEQIISYIEENYSNASLSLQMVASQFGMSEKYLSNFFGEQTGYNFAFFVEKKRLDHAIYLLDSGETVERVSIASGYNSVNTFYRAFKRVYGVSPTAYRNASR